MTSVPVLGVLVVNLNAETAERVFGDGHFNLIKRGADGSLVMSADKWRLDSRTDQAFRFAARAPDALAMTVPVEDVERISWDRLPKQQVRSQIRFYLRNGDLLTFSGNVSEDALPS